MHSISELLDACNINAEDQADKQGLIRLVEYIKKLGEFQRNQIPCLIGKRLNALQEFSKQVPTIGTKAFAPSLKQLDMVERAYNQAIEELELAPAQILERENISLENYKRVRDFIFLRGESFARTLCDCYRTNNVALEIVRQALDELIEYKRYEEYKLNILLKLKEWRKNKIHEACIAELNTEEKQTMLAIVNDVKDNKILSKGDLFHFKRLLN